MLSARQPTCDLKMWDDFTDTIKPQHISKAQGDGGWAKRGAYESVSVGSAIPDEKENIDPSTGLHAMWRQREAAASRQPASGTPGASSSSPLGSYNRTSSDQSQQGELPGFKSPLAPAPAAASCAPIFEVFSDSPTPFTAAPSTESRRKPFADLTKQFSHTANTSLTETVDGGLKKKKRSKGLGGGSAAPAMRSTLRSMR